MFLKSRLPEHTVEAPVAPVKRDPFTLESLIEWLEMKDPGAVYCYLEPGNCLYAQYFNACGLRKISVGDAYLRHGEQPKGEMRTRHYFQPGWTKIASASPHTFGAALERARAVAASRA